MEISPQICVECRHGHYVGPIQLPNSMIASLDRIPEGIMPVLYPLFVACPQCKLVFDGSRNIRHHIAGTRDLRLIPVNKRPILARRLCGVDNCESRIEIHTTVDAYKSASRLLSELETITQQWSFDLTIRCSNTDGGHYLRWAGKQIYTFDGLPPGHVN